MPAQRVSAVQSRQRLNCEHCSRRRRGGWRSLALHIDADGAWTKQADSDAEPVLRGSMPQRLLREVTYRNLEAVPTTSAGAMTISELLKSSNSTRTSTKPHAHIGHKRAFGAVNVARARAASRRLPGLVLLLLEWQVGEPVDAEAVERLVCAPSSTDGRRSRRSKLLLLPGCSGGQLDPTRRRLVDEHSQGRAPLGLADARAVRRCGRASLRLLHVNRVCCEGLACAGYLDGPGSGSWAKRWHTMQHQQNGADEEMKAEAPASADESIHEEHSALFGLSDEAEVERQVKAEGARTLWDRARLFTWPRSNERC